jgi:hypothetical protein
MNPAIPSAADGATHPAPPRETLSGHDTAAVKPEDIDARAFAELDGYGRDWVRRL